MKEKKEGSMIVEFLVIIPVFFLLMWGIMQIILYTNAQWTIDNAANAGARILATELRGYEGKMPTSGTQYDDLAYKLNSKIKTVTDSNGLIHLFHDKDGAKEPTMVFEDKATCLNLLNDPAQHRVICAFTENRTAAGTIDQEQIVVYAKAKFYVIGSMIPTLSDGMYANGKGVSVKELAGRYLDNY